MCPANEAETLSIRLKHAWIDIQNVKAAIHEWSKREPVTPYTECYPRQDKFVYLLRAKVNHSPPNDLGIVIGKAVHQMRAALDNSIASLVPPQFRFSASFPIILDGDMATLLWRSGIDGLSPAIVQYLDSIQPYNTLDRDQRKTHLLHVLNELWNEDKHRTIPVLSSFNTMGLIDYKAGEEIEDKSITRSVYEGAILMKIVSPYAERNFEPKFTYNVAFEDGPASKRGRVETVLIDCHHLTKDILTEIVPDFSFDYPQ